MNKDKYLSSLVSANYKTAVWMLAAGVLLAANLLLVVFLFTIDLSQQTIVVPPDLERPFSIHGETVSPAYIEQMAKYFSQLLLTYHIDNVTAQYDAVLHHVDPTVYADLKARLHAQAERIQRNLVGSVFYPMGIHIAKMNATITGELVGLIGKEIISRKQKYYELQFTYRNGTFYLVRFQELEKGPDNEFRPIEPADDDEGAFS